MTARKTVNVYSIEGAAAGTAALPKVFDTPIRNDIVGQVYTNLAKNQMQPHGVSPVAGIHPSAISWGPGRAKARVPRVNGSGSNRNGQGAYANFCRGGHKFNAPTLQRRWFRPVPIKQRRYAVASAIAATAVAALVEARGHRTAEIPEIPIVVSNAIEQVQKTKQAVEVLKQLKVYADVKKVIDGKYHRSSKGSMRRSAFKTKKGPLVVYNKDEGIVKAFRNIPGVDVQCVTRLSLYQLAPGAVLGRLVVWTEGAFNALDAIYEAKKGFELPKSVVSNADLERVAYSDEVQAVLRPALQSFSVPTARCPVRLGIATQDWEQALNQIEAIRAEYKAKQSTPAAVKAVFDEVVAAQPPAPETLSITDRIFSGYFDALHKKEDDALEAVLEKVDEEPAPAPVDPKAAKAAPADPKAAAAPAAAAGKAAPAAKAPAKGGKK